MGAALQESWAYALSVSAAEEYVQRQLQDAAEEARQMAVALRESIIDSGKGGETASEEALFRELCEAAGVTPEEVHKPVQRSAVVESVEEVVFRRSCERAGIRADTSAREEGRCSQLQELVDRCRGAMQARFGTGWRAQVERNLDEARARHGFRAA